MTEVADDGRQCRGDDGAVERGEQVPGHQAREHDEDLAVGELGAAYGGNHEQGPCTLQ
jgi:hypothetical protein